MASPTYVPNMIPGQKGNLAAESMYGQIHKDVTALQEPVGPARLQNPVRIVLGDTQALATDETIIFDSGTNATLALTPQTAVKLTVKNITANTVTIVAGAGTLIDGAATYVLTTQYQSVSLVLGGTNWHVVGTV